MPEDRDLTLAWQGFGWGKKERESTPWGASEAGPVLSPTTYRLAGHQPLPQSMSSCPSPGAHLQGPRGHPVHDGGPLQAAVLQLPQVGFIQLPQMLRDGQVVVCGAKSRAQLVPSDPPWVDAALG